MASDYCTLSATLCSLHAYDNWGCHCSNDKAGYQVYLNSQTWKRTNRALLYQPQILYFSL